jgi:hypothetical protein
MLSRMVAWAGTASGVETPEKIECVTAGFKPRPSTLQDNMARLPFAPLRVKRSALKSPQNQN